MEEIEDSIADLRTTYRSRKTRSVAWRKNQLRGLIKLVQDNEQKIAKALYHDLGKHPAEVYRDEVNICIYSCQ